MDGGAKRWIRQDLLDRPALPLVDLQKLGTTVPVKKITRLTNSKHLTILVRFAYH